MYTRKALAAVFIILSLTLNALLALTMYFYVTMYQGLREMDVIIGEIKTETAEPPSTIYLRLNLSNPSAASFNLFSIFCDLYLNRKYLGTQVLYYEKPVQIRPYSNTTFTVKYYINEKLAMENAFWTVKLYLALYASPLPIYVPLRFNKILAASS